MDIGTKVLFMGTPDFAIPVLERLIASEDYEVTVVITQPDKARGRGGKVTFSPIKEVAVRVGIPVLQPFKIKEAEAIEALKAYSFDVAVVVAFGQILPKEVLELPRYGCINVHGSLLPRWRGAAPIQWSMLAGDKVTGITTMLMDEGLDTGDTLLTKKITIGEKETGGELFERMSDLGAELLMETLDEIVSGSVKPKEQSGQSTYAKMLTKELGKIDFQKSAVELERMIRALNPWPSAYTTYKGKTLKIWEASVDEEQNGKADLSDSDMLSVGEIMEVTKDTIIVKTGNGNLVIHELQLEGKKRMKTSDFLCGVDIIKGQILGVQES